MLPQLVTKRGKGPTQPATVPLIDDLIHYVVLVKHCDHLLEESPQDKNYFLTVILLLKIILLPADFQ